jgi:ferredoxin-like protein FixX
MSAAFPDPVTLAVVKARLKKVYDEIDDNRIRADADGCDKCGATLRCALSALDDFDRWFEDVEPKEPA